MMKYVNLTYSADSKAEPKNLMPCAFHTLPIFVTTSTTAAAWRTGRGGSSSENNDEAAEHQIKQTNDHMILNNCLQI